VQDLVEFGNAISLVMIIDKIRSPDGISMLGKLPPDYFEKLRLNVPPHLLKLLADVITVLLNRINVPKIEIEKVTDELYERRFQEMFAFIGDYDVQETRRNARQEGRQEKESEMVIQLKTEGLDDEFISRVTKLPIEKIHEIYSTNN